jgi:hypothetical protein
MERISEKKIIYLLIKLFFAILNYFDAESSQGTPYTASHGIYKSAASDGACVKTKALYFVVWIQGFLIPFPSHIKYQLIHVHVFRYRVRTKRNEESLWFGLRLFPI